MTVVDGVRLSPAAVPPTPRALDSQEQTLLGRPVTIVSKYRTGVVTFEYHEGSLVQPVFMGALTWHGLLIEQGTGGPKWRDILPALRHGASESERKMQAVVVDVARRGRATVPRPAKGQTRFKDDRVAQLSDGIRQLAGQMAAITEPSPSQMRGFANRYGELREELVVLRNALTEAEGQFEVVQMQMAVLMSLEGE